MMRRVPASAQLSTVMDQPNQMTLVWQLVHPTLPAAMECLAILRDDGRVKVLIQRGRLREAFGVFVNTATAVRTAFRFGAEMIERGWQKIV
jgi:hypothetical protein